MLMALPLPAFGTAFVTATINALHAAEGAFLASGTALLDFSVDFSGGVAYDCPPISHFRVVIRDAGWLLRLSVAKGQAVEPGTMLAILGTEQGEDPDGQITREARVTLASMLHHDDWWDETP